MCFGVMGFNGGVTTREGGGVWNERHGRVILGFQPKAIASGGGEWAATMGD